MPRSQRAIERYCKAEKLDCFFDVDEQRYYITRAGIERLIGHLKEIQARHEQAPLAPSPTATDSVGHSPTMSDSVRQRPIVSDSDDREARVDVESARRIKELEQEVVDLRITNKGKDYFIDQLKQDREAVVQERSQLIDRLVEGTKRIGILETKLMQLESPKGRVIDTEEGSGEGAQDYAR